MKINLNNNETTQKQRCLYYLSNIISYSSYFFLFQIASIIIIKRFFTNPNRYHFNFSNYFRILIIF